MFGTTLRELRDRIESLASESGDYYLACARYGDRPAPASDLRFETRQSARAAARATEQYRDALRRYDPQLPYYDVIVCRDAPPTSRPNRSTLRPALAASDASDWSLSEPVLDGSTRGRQDLVEFCHRVAATVFETLSTAGHEAVESAVMDAYFGLAESLSSPDELCLCLLESMAAELDRELSPDEQAGLLADSAARLPDPDGRAGPVTGALDRLLARGLLADYTRLSGPTDGRAAEPSRAPDGVVAVRLSEYALSPREGRLPVLPLVVELYRRDPEGATPSLSAAALDSGWRLTVDLSAGGGPAGLATAPIGSDG